MITKEGIKKEISDWLTKKGWKELDRGGQTLKFKTKAERIDYEYRRCTAFPKTSTAEERENAWNYLTTGMAYDKVNGLNVGPLSMVVNGLGENFPDFKTLFEHQVEQGHNCEASIRQAYAFLEVAESKVGSKNPAEASKAHDYATALLKLIDFVEVAEAMSSPYYWGIKDKQRDIEKLQNQSRVEKDPKKLEEINQEIQTKQNQISQFLDSCEGKGLDRELAEDYLADYKVNIANKNKRMAKLKAASMFQISDVIGPNWADFSEVSNEDQNEVPNRPSISDIADIDELGGEN